MTSPLEIRLNNMMNVEIDETKRAQLYAQLGCYLARVGDFERVEKIRLELRKSFGDGRNVRVSILLMLMEGILHLYRATETDPRDRIARANLLSVSFREYFLQALTSAWLAHIDFNRSNYDLMLKEIQNCIENLSHDDGSILSRLALVLGDVFLVCGNSTASQAWYEQARRSATQTGDQATIGAITYNRAAINIQNFRLSELSGNEPNRTCNQVETEINTAINYQALAQLESLDYLLVSARIGLRIAKNEYEIAEKETLELLSRKIVPENCSEHLILLADLSFVVARFGNFTQARELRNSVLERLNSNLDSDDRALIYFLLSKTARLCELQATAESEEQKALDELSKHESEMLKVRIGLERFIRPELVLSS